MHIWSYFAWWEYYKIENTELIVLSVTSKGSYLWNIISISYSMKLWVCCCSWSSWKTSIEIKERSLYGIAIRRLLSLICKDSLFCNSLLTTKSSAGTFYAFCFFTVHQKLAIRGPQRARESGTTAMVLWQGDELVISIWWLGNPWHRAAHDVSDQVTGSGPL